MAPSAKLQKFEAVFLNKIVPELVKDAKDNNMPKEAVDWYERNLVHNTVGGKCNRGMSVVDTYQILTGQESLSDEEYEKAAILGWCTELLQAYFLVADDMMDSSKTRRGNPCWYLVDGVGTIAINDSFMLEAAIYVLIKLHFRSEKYYVDLYELFHETTLQTEYGQLLDLLTAPEDRVNLANFSLAKHSFIVIYKTAFYSFYLPVALAMHMADVASPENLAAAKAVLIPLGEYFQIQDDYLDCYGDPAHIGKIGTDILDNKCSWLVNTALAVVTPEQRQILEENYGQKDSEKEKKVKQLYLDLQLKEKYLAYEEKTVKELKEKIEQVDESNGLKKAALYEFLNKVAGRSK